MHYLNGLGLPSGNTAAGNVRSGDPVPQQQSWTQWIVNGIFPPAMLMSDPPVVQSVPAQSAPLPPQVKTDPRVAALWSRVGDLDSFGLLTATEKNVIADYIRSGKISQAEDIVSEKEKNVAGRRSKFSLSTEVNKFLPIGYKVEDQLIHGVPNYILYAGVVVFGSLTLRKAFRKR